MVDPGDRVLGDRLLENDAGPETTHRQGIPGQVVCGRHDRRRCQRRT